VLLAALIVAGCSTHEVRFEGAVPPEPLTTTQRIDTAHEIVATLLERFAAPGKRLLPSAAAPLGEAALLDAQATRSTKSFQTFRRLASSLLRGRIAVGIGLAYPGADGRTPDSLVTAEVARTLLYFDHVTPTPPWRQAAARAVQAMVTPRLGWTRLRDGYAVREPDAKRRFSIARTADAGLVLAKIADVGGGPLAERYARSAMNVVRRAQTSPAEWHKALGTNAPMPVAERALTLFSLYSRPSKADQDLVLAAIPSVFEQAFHSWGEPRSGPLMGRRGIGAALALRALHLQPGTYPAEHVTRWFVTHRRADGTFEAAASTDATAQAYFALAFAMRGYIFSRGGALP
jgi:hypothetical protein